MIIHILPLTCMVTTFHATFNSLEYTGTFMKLKILHLTCPFTLITARAFHSHHINDISHNIVWIWIERGCHKNSAIWTRRGVAWKAWLHAFIAKSMTTVQRYSILKNIMTNSADTARGGLGGEDSSGVAHIIVYLCRSSVYVSALVNSCKESNTVSIWKCCVRVIIVYNIQS